MKAFSTLLLASVGMFGALGVAQAGYPYDSTTSYGIARGGCYDTTSSYRQDVYGHSRIGYGDSLSDVWNRDHGSRLTDDSYRVNRYLTDDVDCRYDQNRSDRFGTSHSRWDDGRYDRTYRDLSPVPAFHADQYRYRDDSRDLYQRDRMFEPWPGNLQAATPGRRHW